MTSTCKNRMCKARVVPRYIFTARHNLGYHIRYDPIEHREGRDDLQTPLDTLHTCMHTHTHTPSASFKIQWGQGDGTRSICSTLSFAFHASRLFFLKWQYFDAVRGTHYHYFNFRAQAMWCGAVKPERVSVTRG